MLVRGAGAAAVVLVVVKVRHPTQSKHELAASFGQALLETGRRAGSQRGRQRVSGGGRRKTAAVPSTKRSIGAAGSCWLCSNAGRRISAVPRNRFGMERSLTN